MSHHAQTYYVAQAIYKLTMYLRLGLNFWSSCFVLWNVGIKDMHHHAWFTWCWGWNQRFDSCWVSILPTEPDASPIQIVLNSSFASQGLSWRNFPQCKSGSLLHLQKASEQSSSTLGTTVSSIPRRIQEKHRARNTPQLSFKSTFFFFGLSSQKTVFVWKLNTYIYTQRKTRNVEFVKQILRYCSTERLFVLWGDFVDSNS